MKIIAVLVGLLTVAFATQDVKQEREGRQFLVHPSTDFADFTQTPLLPYLLNVNNPLFRQLIRQNSTSSSSSGGVVTTMVNSSSTVTITCTLSTTACAAGRRRRNILSGLLEHQFEEVQPSSVSKIEVTASPDEDYSEKDRQLREANPQLFLASHPNYYKPDASFGHQLSHIRNNFNRQAVSVPLIPSPFNTPINSLLAIFNAAINNFAPPLVANNNPIILLDQLLRGTTPTVWLPGLSRADQTITSTNCKIVLTTVTSTPACSTAGTLPQCPASTAAAPGK